MITIPAILLDGVLVPSSPIPPEALGTRCDGKVYKVAMTAEEAEALNPPPAPASEPVEGEGE